MRVYLSGGMEYADGEGVHWRRDLQQWLEENLRAGFIGKIDIFENDFSVDATNRFVAAYVLVFGSFV